jgi:membrane protease YdiL (CAAX protease family)
MRRTARHTIAHPPRLPFEAFWTLIGASFLALLSYRLLTQFPIWFDEILAKAVLFGLPFLLFAWVSKRDGAFFGLSYRHFITGLFYGLAYGGIFGFMAMFASALRHGNILVPYLFFDPQFWSTFGLAFATAWWESLFFYGLILSVLLEKYKQNEWNAALVTTGLFVLFHAPNLLLRGGVNGIVPLMLLGFFAFGQGVMYLRKRSISAVVVSHAFWGMALLVYTL